MEIKNCRDYSLNAYRNLLSTLKDNGYKFQCVKDFIEYPEKKCVVLRHDSDYWPNNDLRMANLESDLGIYSTYYFRIPKTFKPKIIKEIIKLGHEVGYHYEDLVNSKGNISQALKNFEQNLNSIRTFYPVKTISRHGRPISKIDSLTMWDNIDYKIKFDLIGEAYLDINYTEILYLTDAGGRWNCADSTIRDKVISSKNIEINSTSEFIEKIKKGELPNIIVLNCHPVHWNDNILRWMYRKLIQQLKGIIKKRLKAIRN